MESREGSTVKGQFSIKELVEQKGSSLKWAKKIDFRSLEVSLIEDLVYSKGIPLAITNTTRAWQRDREMFSWDWLKKNCGQIPIRITDDDTHSHLPEWRLSEYIEYIQKPTNQRERRLHGKDLPCPSQWKEFIGNKLSGFWCKGPNDLLGELMNELQPETLVVHLGTEENTIPGNMGSLGSLGHSLMVYADEGAYSLWFCVATGDRDKAIDYWKAKTGGNLHEENQWVPIEELAKAPFNVYVIEQREGDFVLIPPESAHQVVNKGGKNVKVAWNTIRYQTIQFSYDEALPLYKSLGKPEGLRVKATAYYSLINRIHIVEQGKAKDGLIDEFPPLLSIVKDMIDSEWIELDDSEDAEIEVLRFIDDNFPHQRTCDFCSCDIWNRCYHCNTCGKNGGYDICLACVAEGRGCMHKEKLHLMEYLSMKYIKDEFERAQEAYQKLLKGYRRKKNKKKKHEEWEPMETEGASQGTAAFRLVKMYGEENKGDACHQCEKVQPYAQAVLVSCTNSVNKKKCDKKYCAKCLWYRYGQKLVDCFSVADWVCPFCEDSCNCNVCLEKQGVNPGDYSLDKVLEKAVEAYYPFQCLSLPNVPCVSDFKPHGHMHALKKRKIYGIGAGSASPSAWNTPQSPVSKEAQKVEKQTHPLKPMEIHSEVNGFLKVEAVDSPKQEMHKLDVKVEATNGTDSRTPSPVTGETNGDSHQPSAWDSSQSQQNWESNSSWPETGDLTLNPDAGANGLPAAYDVDHHSTVLVRNLSYACTAEDLEEMFKQCGVIDQITIPLDKTTGKLRGYGFVKFTNRADAEDAMTRLNYRILKDRVIELEWSVDKSVQKKIGENRNLVCYKCGKEGHFARSCPKLMEMQLERDPREVERERELAEREKEWERIREQERLENEKKREVQVHRGYICFKCGKEGHVASDCKEKQELGPGFKGVICFKCGQGGHLANKCDKRMRGCYICGKDGHIAVECTEKFNQQPVRAQEEYNQPSENNWTAEPNQKYRKTESPTQREPAKDPLWDERERDRDRERLRDRKVNSWDERDMRTDSRSDPRMDVRSTPDPRVDPRMDARGTPDLRLELRGGDPRMDVRSTPDPRVDPRMDNRDPRMDVRGTPDPRVDPRMDNRDPRADTRNYPAERPYKHEYADRVYTDPRMDVRINDPRNGLDMRADTRYSDRYSREYDPRYSRESSSSSRYSTRPEERYSTDAYPRNNYQDPKTTEYRQPDLVPPMTYYGQPIQPIPYAQQPVVDPSMYLNGQIPQLAHLQIAVPNQVVQPVVTTPKNDDSKKRNFKHHCSKIVVNRLSSYFNSGHIGSKDDFKQLSRKIVSSIMEKEQPRGYPVDKDTDQKIKKYVEHYYTQYQGLVSNYKEKNRAKVESWLQQAYSPTNATSL